MPDIITTKHNSKVNMDQVETLGDVESILQQDGHDASASDTSVIAKINNLPAVITINNGYVNINCQVATLGDIPEDNVPVAFAEFLSANTVINPYAFGLIDSSDDPSIENAEEFQVILTDRLPIGDLSEDEFRSSLDSLRGAISEARNILQSVTQD